MIIIRELEKRINLLLKIFKKRTKVIACTLLDVDGFVIASIEDDYIQKHSYYKKIVSLYSSIEDMNKFSPSLMDIKKKWEKVSFSWVDEYFSNGFVILVRSIGEIVVLMAVFPKLLDMNKTIKEFEKIIKELSLYFLQAQRELENSAFKNIYKLT